MPAKKFTPLKPGDQPINEHDEGALTMACSFDPTSRQIILAFGKPVSWLGMTADDAESMANALMKNAAIARGKTH